MYENPCFIYSISWSKQKSLTFILYGYFHWMQNFRMCFFSFSNLDVSFHCPFTYIVSEEKSGEILLFVLLYVLGFFPLQNFLKIFCHWFFSNFSVIWLVMFWVLMHVCEFSSHWVSMKYLICAFIFFILVWKNSGITLQMSPSPFQDLLLSIC